MLCGAAGAAVFGRSAIAGAAEVFAVPPADREFRVPVQGGNLYVRVNGEIKPEKPPLLLVHGGPGGALFQFFPALPLASDRAIILYDQLDSGRSDAPGNQANWTIDRFVSEIDAIRAALNIERLHLLGHSWGGIIANRYAAARPTGLLSLILQGSPPSDSIMRASMAQALAALPDGAGAIIAAHDRAGTTNDPAYGKAMQVFIRKHLSRTSIRAIGMAYMEGTPADRGDAVAMAMTGEKINGFDGVLEGFDDTPLMRRITVPTLLLCGEFDIMTPTVTKALLPLLQQGSFEELPGAGHMAQFDRPDAWRMAVSRFIRKYDARR